jgi:hypothetical protein
METAQAVYEQSGGQKQRLFEWLRYAADTWDKERWVIGKPEYTQKGASPRYVVTHLGG